MMDPRRNSFCNLIDFVATGVDVVMEGSTTAADDGTHTEPMETVAEGETEEPSATTNKKKDKKKKKQVSIEEAIIPEKKSSSSKKKKDKKASKKSSKKKDSGGSDVEMDSGDDLSLGSIHGSSSSEEEEDDEEEENAIHGLSTIANSDDEGDNSNNLPNTSNDPRANILAQAAKRRATMTAGLNKKSSQSNEGDLVDRELAMSERKAKAQAETEDNSASSSSSSDDVATTKKPDPKQRRHTLGAALKGFQIDVIGNHNNDDGLLDMVGLTANLPKLSLGTVKQKYNFNQDPKRRENAFDTYMNTNNNNNNSANNNTKE